MKPSVCIPVPLPLEIYRIFILFSKVSIKTVFQEKRKCFKSSMEVSLRDFFLRVKNVLSMFLFTVVKY